MARHFKLGRFFEGTAISIRLRHIVQHRFAPPFALASFSRYFPPAVAKTYVVTFRSHNDDRPSKFIVVANDRKQAINVAWEHGGADFQSRFDKSTVQAQ